MTGSVKRILLVDDEPEFLEVLREFIATLGYPVETASNGPDALLAVLRNRPDLVCLDISMPGMNGVETLKQIRSLDRTIPVIMLTGEADIQRIGNALTGGAFAYVPKSAKFEYLQHLIAAVVEGDKSSPARPSATG